MRHLIAHLLIIVCAVAVSPATALAAKDSATGPTVLITGANRGIGLALAEQFTKAGYRVIGTARAPDKATALAALGASVEALDVAESASVAELAKALQGKPIDILINNAGIIGHDAKTFAALEVDQLDTVYQVNVLGPLRVTQALLPNLEQGSGKTVANISSMMGSMELNTWGCCLGYRASKAALNSANQTLSVEFGKAGFTFVVLHPGYVKTDMNEGEGNYTPAQSAEGLFGVISRLSPADNGKFYDLHGKAMPW